MSQVSKLSTFVHTEDGRRKYFNRCKWSLSVCILFVFKLYSICLNSLFYGGFLFLVLFFVFVLIHFLVFVAIVVSFSSFWYGPRCSLFCINWPHCIWSIISLICLFSLSCNIIYFFISFSFQWWWVIIIWMRLCAVKRKGWAPLQLPEWSC